MALRILLLAERFPPEVAGGGELSAALVARAIADQPDVTVRVLTQGDGREGEVDGVPVSYTIPRAPGVIPDDIKRAELLTARSTHLVATALRDADLVHSVSTRTIPAAVAGARLAGKPATSVMNDNWATCFVSGHVRRGELCLECSSKGLRTCLEDIGGNVKASPILFRQFRRRVKAVRSLGGVVAISPSIERLLRTHGVQIPIVVIPVPFDFGPWKGMADRSPEEGLVLFTGRIAPGKGVLEALEAFAVAAGDRPRARLLIAGDGSLLEQARRRAEDLGLGKRVEFPGWVPPQDLPALYARAQVVLSPFLRVEAFGRVLLEAAAAGRPVVTTDIGGGTEMLHAEPGAGIVVPWMDVDAWSTALGRLLDDPGEATAMGEEANRRARALYAPAGVGPRYTAFFGEVIDGRG